MVDCVRCKMRSYPNGIDQLVVKTCKWGLTSEEKENTKG